MHNPGGASRPAFLRAEWRYLVMLNYDVPPDALAPFVPLGTTLDLWQGRALASVVGFRFLRTTLLGVPVPFHRDFDEVNLRFYVKREMRGGEIRRGVTFIREIVPRPAIAAVAHLVYNEPYLALPMRSDVPRNLVAAPGTLRYSWRRRTPAGRVWEQLSARTVGEPVVPAADSEARFITEHYWGYTAQRGGGTVEYEVSHPQWRVWAADSPQLQADVASLYGPQFVDALTINPRSVVIAEGSAITVYRPTRIA